MTMNKQESISFADAVTACDNTKVTSTTDGLHFSTYCKKSEGYASFCLGIKDTIRLRDYLNRAVEPAAHLIMDLPTEFMQLCADDNVEPMTVIRGFIADLCGIQSYVSDPRPDGYASNGSDERCMARDYYERVGYPYMPGATLDPNRKKRRRKPK